MKFVPTAVLAAALVQSIPPAITGQIVRPDGAPAADATVIARAAGSEFVALVDERGYFRLPAEVGGTIELVAMAPGLWSRPLQLTVRPGQALTLPAIRLTKAPYARLRVVSPTGEPMTSPHLLGRSFGADGRALPHPSPPASAVAGDMDGDVRFGPLGHGILELAIDTPPHARTRLPAIVVSGESPEVNVGTVRLARGASLRVAVVDLGGRPVAGHEVAIEESVAFSPMVHPARRTDANGHVEFDRLAAGRYKIRTRAITRCAGVRPSVERWVVMPAEGAVSQRIVVQGVELRLRLTSAGAPVAGAQVTIPSDGTFPQTPTWFREGSAGPPPFGRPSGVWVEHPCSAISDADGRAVLSGVLPGPARAMVRLPNSIWTGRITAPVDGTPVTLPIAPGLSSVRVLSAKDGSPVFGAAVEWSAGGVRIEARSSATGDALFEGVPEGAASVTVRANGFTTRRVELERGAEPTHQLSVEPVPNATLRCRVVEAGGDPVAGAVVVLNPDDPLDPLHAAQTDRSGLAEFAGLRARSAHVIAYVARRESNPVHVSLGTGTEITLTLAGASGRN